MKYLFILLMLVFFLLKCPVSGSRGHDYRHIFNIEYREARAFLVANNQIIEQVCGKYEIDGKLVRSIVFPELIRYSLLSDFFETTGLRLLYVNYGTAGADFSIGLFQMKPSFVESLEVELQRDCFLSAKYKEVIKFAKTGVTEIRGERLNRMQSVRWQVIYLCAFIDLVQKKYEINISSHNEMLVKFLSSAYNCGFQNGREVINMSMQWKYFPYGSRYKGTQYAYCDVAWYFYENELLTSK